MPYPTHSDDPPTGRAAQVGDLADLIHPVAAKDFLAQDWGRAARLFAPGIAGRTGSILDLASFELMLATLNRAHEGWLHLARGARRPVPAELVDAEGMLDLTALRAAFHAGDTLYLTKAHRAWPPLMRLCRGVENELRGDGVRLRAPVSAHVFLTPPRSQGFAAHRDEHASLVLQLEGTKDWDVYEEDPDDDGQPRAPYRTGRVDVDRLRAVRQTFTLTPGNVLYLPEWWVHAARTGDRHSLHVTLRVFPLRWVDLLTAVLPQVDGLDRPVPHERAGSDGAARLAEDLVARLTSARVRAAISPLVRRHLDGTRVPTTALPDDGLGGVLAADRLGVTTRLARSAGTACAVATHGDVATLSFPGGTLTGPAELGPVFTYIADAVRFRPADLPAVGGEYDRTALARELLLAGVVRVEDAEGEAR